MVKKPYVPRRGDVIWINMSPHSGREQAGRRPAIVLSPEKYNNRVGLALVCPITSRIKGYPFEVMIPETTKIEGAILADHLRSVDWNSRETEFACALPEEITNEVVSKALLLLKP
jgi:mRNA interferase MazF